MRSRQKDSPATQSRSAARLGSSFSISLDSPEAHGRCNRAVFGLLVWVADLLILALWLMVQVEPSSMRYQIFDFTVFFPAAAAIIAMRQSMSADWYFQDPVRLTHAQQRLYQVLNHFTVWTGIAATAHFFNWCGADLSSGSNRDKASAVMVLFWTVMNFLDLIRFDAMFLVDIK